MKAFLVSLSLVYLIPLALFYSCKVSDPNAKPVYLGGGISRYEDDEAICYTVYNEGISCHWKKK